MAGQPPRPGPSSGPSFVPTGSPDKAAQGPTGPSRRWTPAAWEARLLADSLRSERVVLLHGSDAADRRAFIEQALLPLLGRRGEDHASMPGPVPRALPAAERRRHPPSHAEPVGRDPASAETVLLLDDWEAPPPAQRLTPLAERLRQAGLPANPAAQGGTPGRVLLILLGFEPALAEAATASHPDPFWLELAQLPQHSAHDVHLLLVTGEPTRSGGLAWLKQLLPMLGEHSLKLDRPAPATLPPWATSAATAPTGPTGAAAPPQPQPTARAEPSRAQAGVPRPAQTMPADDEWLSSVRMALRDVAARSRLDQAPVSTDPPPPASTAAERGAVPRFVPTAPAVPLPAGADEPLWEHFSADAYDAEDDDLDNTAGNDGAVPHDDWTTPVRYEAHRPAPPQGMPPVLPMAPRSARSRAVRIGAGLVVLAGVAGAAGWWLRPLGLHDLAPVSALMTPAEPQAAAPTATTEPTAAAAPTAPTSPTATTAALSPEAELKAAPPAAGLPAAASAAATAPVATPAPVAVAEPAASAATAPPPIRAAGFEPGQAVLTALTGLPVQDLRGERAQAIAALTQAPQATLAVVRQDVLQNLPASPLLGGLRVVAPLFAEPVQAWVRADSSWRRWRDLGAASIDIGRDRGDAQIARSLPRDLFGAPEWVDPSAHWRSLSDGQALAALRRGDVDAVLRVRASPLTAEAQAAVARGALRVLTLDPGESARVLGRYVSAPAPGARSLRTAGVMNFLVVQGGDTEAAREQLASEALRTLCSTHPALSAAAGSNWAMLRPDQALPAGRPYAAASASAAAACASQVAGPALAPHRPR